MQSLDCLNNFERKPNLFHFFLSYDYFLRNFYKSFMSDHFIREVYDINFQLTSLKRSDFKYFFKSLKIDTPLILNKVDSLSRIKGKSTLKSASKYIMRKGKGLKYSQLYLKSILSIISNPNTLSFGSYTGRNY